jgi:hypothetical protein
VITIPQPAIRGLPVKPHDSYPVHSELPYSTNVAIAATRVRPRSIQKKGYTCHSSSLYLMLPEA